MLLFVAMASNIGVILNVMFFDAQECRLFAEKYGIYALQNVASCKGLTAGGYLSVSELDSSAYVILLFLPLPINSAMIALTSKKGPVTLASFRYYCGVLALLACHVMIIGFLGLGNLLTNSYYLGNRCPIT